MSEVQELKKEIEDLRYECAVFAAFYERYKMVKRGVAESIELIGLEYEVDEVLKERGK
jgi:hypothetical protein